MHATELIIGNQTYVLPPGTDEAAVLEQLTDAVRAGGGVVDLPAPPTSMKSVLISPGVPIFIERIPIPDDTVENDEDAEREEQSGDDWTF